MDAEQQRDVARWRKVERERLIARRLALTPEQRAEHSRAIGEALDELLTITADTIISGYWPIRGEPDLRPWLQTLRARGARIALPVALALHQPLTFREWQADAPLARGLWNIPYPAAGAELVPTVVIAPLVGFDRQCYRLGYGGGFFDRTLAALKPRPTAIGVGLPDAVLPSIFPQPHDIAMNQIVTGPAERASRSQP